MTSDRRVWAGGLTNRELGEACHLTAGTVKVYLSKYVFRAIGVKSRHEAAMWALRNLQFVMEPNGGLSGR